MASYGYHQSSRSGDYSYRKPVPGQQTYPSNPFDSPDRGRRDLHAPPPPPKGFVSRLDPGRPAPYVNYFDRPSTPLYHEPEPQFPAHRPYTPQGRFSTDHDPYSSRGNPYGEPYHSSPYSDRYGDPYGDPYADSRANKGRQYSDEIPLKDNPQAMAAEKAAALEQASERTSPERSPDGEARGSIDREMERRRQREQRRSPSPEKHGFFSRKTTWCVYAFTAIQLVVFVAQIVRNSVLTGSPIEIKPQINPMLGPSFSVLINMGARYVPCMKNVTGLPANTGWPCPNTTTNDPNDPSNHCSIQELCGFQDFGGTPNQWFRFITPIFLHAGLVHIGFNLLLQLTLGREIEQIIGPIRFLVVYMSSGIFGFVLGGNYAGSGIASMGASGSLFGLIAINLLDLLYTWNERKSPKKELAFIFLDIVVSFALGMLPGLDNFAHIGGFLMGLVLGICILHSPNLLRHEKTAEPPSERSQDEQKKRRKKRARRVSYKSFAKDPAGFFRGRKALWWVWWVVRAGALLGVLIAFIVLLNNFYNYHDTCSWCKYLSCINVNHWCDMGNLTAMLQNTTTPKSQAPGSPSRLFARAAAGEIIQGIGGAVDLTPFL